MPAVVDPTQTGRSGVMVVQRKSRPDCDEGACESMVGVAAPALVFLALIIAATATIAARAAIVRAAPWSAAAYASSGMPVNLRGLSIDGVRATFAESAEDHRELLVTGEIVNLRQVETTVPNLRLTVRGEDRRELYRWTAPEPKSRLGPHERV